MWFVEDVFLDRSRLYETMIVESCKIWLLQLISYVIFSLLVRKLAVPKEQSLMMTLSKWKGFVLYFSLISFNWFVSSLFYIFVFANYMMALLLCVLINLIILLILSGVLLVDNCIVKSVMCN